MQDWEASTLTTTVEQSNKLQQTIVRIYNSME